MDMMDGLAGTLAGMKEDAMVAAKMGGGFVLGVALARGVDVGLNQLDFVKTNDAVKTWVVPAVPLLVGLALFSKTRDSYPALGGANGLGMIAYGLASYVKSTLKVVAKGDTSSLAAKADAFISLGAVDNYESTILAGLGYSDMSVNRYLPRNLTTTGWNGLGADMRSPGAPTFVETINGAVTTITPLNAAPMTSTIVSNSLQGLSATLM